MKRQKTKTKITISVDKKLNDIMMEILSNKSKYVEWLIYQDMLKKTNDEKINDVII